MVTCRTCNRTVRHHGKSRSFLWALKSNAPTAANKASPKTPKRTASGSTDPGQSTHGSRGKSPSWTIRYFNLLAVWNMKYLFHVRSWVLHVLQAVAHFSPIPFACPDSSNPQLLHQYIMAPMQSLPAPDIHPQPNLPFLLFLNSEQNVLLSILT